jgi:hypothetical protein
VQDRGGESGLNGKTGKRQNRKAKAESRKPQLQAIAGNTILV